MRIKQHIPNLFTLGNLLCGSAAIIGVLQNHFSHWSVLLIFVAGILDVFDGAIARALGVADGLGKQLDSLADVISFGLAPSVIVFSALQNLLPEQYAWLSYVALINVACAAYRLAKFNIATDQSTDFSGMPSPANGIFWASIAAVVWEMDNGHTWLIEGNPIYYVAVVIFLLITMSFLMISKIRMFGFKFKKGGFAANTIPYVFIFSVLTFPVITWLFAGSILLCVPLGIAWYLLLSIVYHYNSKKQLI